MWQALYEELSAHPFIIVAVAFDSRPGAAEPWIAEGGPTYPVLLDPFHHVANLYNMVNVNQAVWIDENGVIVRPTESAGVYEAFRKTDRTNGEVPADEADKATRVRELYHEALKDWAANGAASAYAIDAESVRANMLPPTDATVTAHATFVLGQYLIAQGNEDEGNALVARASELHPDSWAIWRQGAPLNATGLAATQEFWDRVDALGDKRYYASIDLPGMPA